MEADEIQQLTVLGAGTMGHGIGEIAALQGLEVKIRDIKREFLDQGMEAVKGNLRRLEEKGRISSQEVQETLDRIVPVVSMEEAVSESQLILEAVPEKEKIKRKVFEEADHYAPEEALLASNTSSLSITKLSTFTKRPSRFLGLHFFNPPQKMKLVEVVEGEETNPHTIKVGMSFARRLGKTPVHCQKDHPGFIVNAVLFPYLLEACWSLDRGEGAIPEIDAAVKYDYELPMGPFELIDLVGLDVTTEIGKAIDWPVPDLLTDKVDAGELGRKSGNGFYDYEDGGATYDENHAKEYDALPLISVLINAAAELLRKNVATPEAIETGLKLGAGFPKGPLEMAKSTGVDKVQSELESLRDRLDLKRYSPSPILEEGTIEG